MDTINNEKAVDPFAKLIDMACDIATEEPESPLGDYVRIAREIITVMEADEVRKDWLDAANIAAIQAPGNIIPNVVIQDNRLEQPRAQRADQHGADAPSQADVIDAIIGREGVIVMDEFPILPMADATKAANLKGIAAAEKSGALPTGTQTEREFNVMLRRPINAYATESIMAKDAPDAVEKMKWATENGRLPASLDWDANTDGGSDIDWIQAEAADGEPDHAEWEPVKLSPAVLVEALNKLKLFATNSGDLQNKELRLSMEYVERIATEALNKAILGE